jgi:uncharacterized protein YdhG (YjbR/CyaY superfamily)
VSNWNPQKSVKNFQLQSKKLIQFRKKRFLDKKELDWLICEILGSSKDKQSRLYRKDLNSV